MIKLVPVIDILNGQVVRGVAGERDIYQPNKSQLLTGSDPVETAEAFIEAFDVETIYIADLNALTGSGSSAEIIREISKLGIKTVVDASITTAAGIQRMMELGVDQIVIPLEAITSLSNLEEVVAATDVERLVFSLDLKSGVVLGPLANKFTPQQLTDEVHRFGFRKLIVLDLAGVGVSDGVPTIPLCKEIKATHADFTIWTGGGVRSITDIQELNESAIDSVLVASALHDGLVTANGWKDLFSGKLKRPSNLRL